MMATKSSPARGANSVATAPDHRRDYSCSPFDRRREQRRPALSEQKVQVGQYLAASTICGGFVDVPLGSRAPAIRGRNRHFAVSYAEPVAGRRSTTDLGLHPEHGCRPLVTRLI